MPPRNLYKRGETYFARFSVNGQLRRVSLRTGDLREAKARLKAALLQAERAVYGIQDAPVWQMAVLAYKAGVLDSGGVKPGTAKRYLVSLGQLGPHFDGKPLPTINTREIGDYVATRQAAGATNATIRRDLTTLSRVLAYAAQRGMIEKNAADRYDRKLVRERRAPIRAPEDDAVEAAAKAVEPFAPGLGALVRFLRANGVRAGEALRATWADVRDGQLTIHETKSGRVRTIEVRALPTSAGKGRLSPTLPLDTGTLAGKWAWARRKAGFSPFRLHDLRHAYAIGEIRAGRDIYDLSRHMGHGSVAVTEVYLAYRPARASNTKKASTKVASDTKTVASDGKDVDNGGGEEIRTLERG